MALPMVVPGNLTDRRRRPRFKLAYPVRLRQPGKDVLVEAKTKDLSCEGFFCISNRAFSAHEILECELLISGDQPWQLGDQDMVLRCRAEVVRMVSLGASAFGLACRLTDYTVDQQIVTRDLTVECVS